MMDLDSGIFIPCNPGEERDCLTATQGVLKESKNSITVEMDKTHGGLRLIFADASKAQDVLAMRRVSPRFPVYPLTTSLVVHTDQSKFKDDFHELLRDAVKDVGPVVDVHRIPFIENMTDFFTNDWKVVLGVPEKDDLPSFRRAGLPDDMTLNLPGFQTGFRVTFCCSSCKGEHTTWNCPSKTPVKTETQSSRIDSVAATKGEESDRTPTTPKTVANEFRIRDRREDGKPLLKRPKPFDTDSMAQKIGEEQVLLSTLGDSLISPKRKVTKIEIGNSSTTNMDLLLETDRMLSSIRALKSSATSESDTEVTVLDEFRTDSKSKKALELNLRSSIEESPQVTTSSLPDGFGDVKSELPSTDENSDSNMDTVTPPASTPYKIPKARKSITADFSVHIPEPIKKIIQETPGILDVTRLEAFFNNVKKKSSPCIVAEQYTNNVSGLKTQLQSIKDKYYNAPVMHSVKEKQFMKWFEPMLDRFDRKPCIKPRKRMVPISLHQM